MIVDAFEAVKFSVGGAEASSADERREIGAGRFLDVSRKSAFAQSLREQAGLTFEKREIFRRVFGCRERGGKTDAVVIANDRFPLPFGRGPAAPFRSASRKSPGEKKRKVGGCARWNGALKRNNSDG